MVNDTFSLVADLCGRSSIGVAILTRDKRSALPGVALAAIATHPLSANIPRPERKSCSAGVALPQRFLSLNVFGEGVVGTGGGYGKDFGDTLPHPLPSEEITRLSATVNVT